MKNSEEAIFNFPLCRLLIFKIICGITIDKLDVRDAALYRMTKNCQT